jgi:Ni,Fe-hydrogenase I large subunit
MIGAFNPNTQWNSSVGGWLGHSAMTAAGQTYKHYAPPTTAGNKGVGGNEAPRGALMHVCTTDGAKIVAYQCIVPTTWNGSPKDGTGAVGAFSTNPATRITNNNAAATKRGPIEMAVIGAPYDNTQTDTLYGFVGGGSGTTSQSGVEVLRCAQSFDPCIACAVH